VKEKIYEALETFYDYEVPAYVRSAGKTFITFRVSDWEGARTLKITLKDVIAYYATQAGNIWSGIRTLADHSDDWRPIDHLASEALEWFQYINHSVLEREGEKQGMTLIS
jgi:hypothetical protein